MEDRINFDFNEILINLEVVKNKQRLLLTPHIAWASIEARKRLIEKVAKNIEDFLKS